MLQDLSPVQIAGIMPGQAVFLALHPQTTTASSPAVIINGC
jgi:hypothetical protein